MPTESSGHHLMRVTSGLSPEAIAQFRSVTHSMLLRAQAAESELPKETSPPETPIGLMDGAARGAIRNRCCECGERWANDIEIEIAQVHVRVRGPEGSGDG